MRTILCRKEVIRIANNYPSNLEATHKGASETQGQSKIDQYGLGEIVRELRNQNKSYKTIAKELNDHYLKGDMPKTSHMAVGRWIKNNIKEDGRQPSKDMAVNIYKEQCSMLDTIDSALETLEAVLDDFQTRMSEDKPVSTTEIKDASMTLTRLVGQKQSLVNSIEMTQEKIYNYMAVNEIVNTTLDIVKAKDLMLYSEIVDKLKSNPMLVEAFRRIKE